MPQHSLDSKRKAPTDECKPRVASKAKRHNQASGVPVKASTAATTRLSRPVRARSVKQNRSLEAQNRIATAAVQLIAELGINAVTHRLVATRAGVSLAATTYYYDSKFDILAEAANLSMQLYADAFSREAARPRFRSSRGDPFKDFAFRLIRNSTGRHRNGTLAWAELAIDAVRHPQSLKLSRDWYAHIKLTWTEIARVLGAEDPVALARTSIDTCMGLLFVTAALGLTAAELDAVLVRSVDLRSIRDMKVFEPTSQSEQKLGRKSQETRQRIVDAAIAILVSDGRGEVNFRNVAKRAGLTPGAPAYHFANVDALLHEALIQLLDESRRRYRSTVSARAAPDTLDELIDLTAAVFQKEASKFGTQNLANFTLWLEATRQETLQPKMFATITNQHRAWQLLLARLTDDISPLHGILAQAMFAGKLIRILSTGARPSDLALARGEFAQDLRALVDGSFWALPR